MSNIYLPGLVGTVVPFEIIPGNGFSFFFFFIRLTRHNSIRSKVCFLEHYVVDLHQQKENKVNFLEVEID